MKKLYLLGAMVCAFGMMTACKSDNKNNDTMERQLTLTQEWDKVFPLSDKVNHKKVTFGTQYGLTLAADLYTPKDAEGKLPAIAVSGPFGATKEQSSGIYAKIPDDMPEKLALSALDVAGAPAQTANHCQYGQTVLILGAGGKSGMLCAYEAKKRVGVTGKVIGIANSPKSTQRIKDLGFCDVVESAAGLTPVQVYEMVERLTDGKMADVTINCVNVPDQEMTAVLCTKDDGIVYFFSMATSFTKASLGAEGIGADVNMIMGNGYTKGHAEFTLQELRESPKLRKIFEELYA